MSFPDHRDHPVFWLRRAALVMRKVVDDELSQLGLTGAQSEVLLQLWQQDELEQHRLLEQLGVTSPTLTGIIDGLVDRGLVERRPSHEDARVKLVCLTPQGAALFQTTYSAIEAAHALLLEGFSQAEATLLRDWLRRIVANGGGPDDR